jgi:hypothetical protein
VTPIVAPEEYLQEAEQRARRFSGAYTGTAGTLAADVVRLVAMIRRMPMPPDDAEFQPEHPSAAVALLDEARAAVIDRHGKYGPPKEHFARTVGMVNAAFSAVLRRPLTPADWALIMVLDKVSRHMGTAKTTDTPIDVAGYAACLAECEAE